MTRRSFAFLIAVTVFLLASFAANAQCPASILATDLKAPTKIIFSTTSNLLVAEQGNGPNTGRISIIDKISGARRTLIDGLPSGFAAPNNDPSGPSGLVMRGRTLYVSIGAGDSVINGNVPGVTFVPNPSPVSPLFSSVLAIHFSASVEMQTAGFALSFADQATLKSGIKLNLANGSGDQLSVELVADFADYSPEPNPLDPNNVRPSNPFGVEIAGDRLYVADAAANAVREVDLASGAFHTITTFGPLPNNRGFGPPVVEAVPDSLHLVGNQLLVTLLTGFPFPIGNAEVRSVDPTTGTNTPFVGGLTSAIDVLATNDGGLLILEFSTDMLAGMPGRLSFRASPMAAPEVIANCLITPTSMAQEAKAADIFVTEIFTGRVIKITQ